MSVPEQIPPNCPWNVYMPTIEVRVVSRVPFWMSWLTLVSAPSPPPDAVPASTPSSSVTQPMMLAASTRPSALVNVRWAGVFHVPFVILCFTVRPLIQVLCSMRASYASLIHLSHFVPAALRLNR